MNETELEFLEDMNACASEALEQLTTGRLDDARTTLKGLLDALSERLSAMDQS